MTGFLKKINITYLSIFREYPLLIYISIVSLLAEIGYSVIIPTLPLYLVEGLKVGVTFVGFSIGAYALSETVFKIPCGIFGDRAGRKYTIVLGSLIPSVCMFLMAHVKNPNLFVILWAIAGFGAAALWPGIIAYISDTVSHDRKATALSVFNMCYMVGLGVGPMFGILLNLCFAFQGTKFHLFTFYLGGMLLFLAFLVAILKLENIHLSISVSASQEYFKNLISYIKSYIKRYPDVLILAFLAFLFMFSGGIVAPVLIIYAKQDIGLSETAIRLLFLPVAIFLAVVSIPIGRFSDRLGKKIALIVGLSIIGGVMIISVEVKSYLALFFLIGIVGIGYGMVLPSHLALVSIISPKESKGLAVGIAGTGQSMGFILGPLVGGYIWEIFGHKTPFLVSGYFLLFSAVLVFLVFRKRKF